MDSLYLAYYALTSNLFVFVSVCKVKKKLFYLIISVTDHVTLKSYI